MKQSQPFSERRGEDLCIGDPDKSEAGHPGGEGVGKGTLPPRRQ